MMPRVRPPSPSVLSISQPQAHSSIDANVWDDLRPFIETSYCKKGKCLEEIREAVRKEFGFIAS
jgi:hypothetical protein